jgi:hypothetical protein
MTFALLASMPCFTDHSVLIMITATSMLSGTGVVSSLTGGGGEASSQCDSRACFASKVRATELQSTASSRRQFVRLRARLRRTMLFGSAG